MLVLLFQAGEQRYALDASRIREVMPLVNIRPVPFAPEGVAGVLDYRGAPAPVLDLSALLQHGHARSCLSTRLIVVDYPDATGAMRALGLIAERATRTVRWQAADLADCGIASDRAPYLGGVARDADGFVQLIDIGRLLPPAVCQVLFKNGPEQPWSPPASKAC